MRQHKYDQIYGAAATDLYLTHIWTYPEPFKRLVGLSSTRFYWAIGTSLPPITTITSTNQQIPDVRVQDVRAKTSSVV